MSAAPVIVNRSVYREMTSDLRLLRALQNVGVESWAGYEEALRAWKDMSK